MLTRERIILYLLSRTAKPVRRTSFVKLVFLLRHETSLKDFPTFYDFVPYHFGPFSFTLYSELERLRRRGLVAAESDSVELDKQSRDRACEEANGITVPAKCAVQDVLSRYGGLSRRDLVSSVYRRYPWFAINSQLPERRMASAARPHEATPAVYTLGYERKSIDAFLNRLLVRGIRVLIDVRANPISRKYGFSGKRLGQLCKGLGLEYCHVPTLGIPSSLRANLGGRASYRRLLDLYEQSILPQQRADVQRVVQILSQRASVLVCFEEDVSCCHRERLANAVAKEAGMEIVHLR